MKKSLYIHIAAVIICILCFSGCAGLRDAYIRANTTPTPVPLPSSVIGQGVVDDSFCTDINGDDVYETVTVCTTGGKVVLYVSDADKISMVKVNYGAYVSSFITKTESGSACVLVCVDLGQKEYVTSVISFDNTKPVYQSGVLGCVTVASGADIRIERDVHFLGSWHSYSNYKLSNYYDLEVVTDQIITMDGKKPLHVIKKLPVEMLADGVYVERTLDPGAYIYPESTDSFTYLKFKLEDGSSGIINVHTSGSDYFIGGLIHDYEYFDNIEYWD